MDTATFFFPLEVSQKTAEAIAQEVGERCAVDARTSVRMGTSGWFIDVASHHIREKDKAKIYSFLYGVEFAMKRFKLT